MSVRRRLLALALAMAAATSCGGDEPEAPPASKAAPKSDVRTLAAKVEVVATGAVAVDYREATDVTVSLFQPGKVEVSLLTVGLAEERRLGNLAFRTAFDLAGQYVGPDRYEIPAVGAASGASSISGAFLLTAELKDPAGGVVEDNVTSARRFDRPLDPCEVVVAEDERSGTMTCPRLADADGQTVDLRMTWTADE